MTSASKRRRSVGAVSIGVLLFFGAARSAWAFSDAAATDTSAKRPARPTTAATSPPAKSEAGEAAGIVFTGPKADIAKVKAAMQHLLGEMGWTAGQVRAVESAGGESVSYVLSSGSADSDTLSLIRRPELGLAHETIEYVGRLGQKRSVTLGSKKEILAAMLVPGRRFDFSGPHASVASLEEQIAIRQNAVYWGFRAGWIFPEGTNYQYDAVEHWEPKTADQWTLRPGVEPSAAVADAFVGKSFYIIGCTSACRFIYAQAVFDYYLRIKPNPGLLARLQASLDPRRPFVGMWPAKSRDGKPPADGRFLARHQNVPWNHWVPGDWGWIKNTDEKSRQEFGSEGSNIIYAGGGSFVNYYYNHPPKNLDQALKRVYGWSLGLEESELPLDEAAMNRLRSDPRDGGLLRDVRDFPRLFD